MDAYVYQAALLCEDCAHGVMNATVTGYWPDCTCGREANEHTYPDDHHRAPQRHGCREYAPDESTYDSDDFPKGPYPDGGGWADSPQACDQCMIPLDNPIIPIGDPTIGAIGTVITDADVQAAIERGHPPGAPH